MKSKIGSLVFIGAASYLFAWFLPVVEGGSSLTNGTLPGWEAFRWALSPLWPYGHLEPSASFLRPDWGSSLLGVVSGLTNFVLVGALLQIILKPRQSHPLFRAMLFASGAFNTWLLLSSDRGGLRVGYYLWTVAYFLVAIGIAQNQTRKQGTPEAV